MASGLRALRWRAATGLVGLGLVWAWVVMSGRASHTIQIDWAWAPEQLDSAEVEINGEIVGVLLRYGRNQTVTGFRVEPGEYVVRVLADDCEGVPETARLGGRDGRLVTFVADYEDDFSCRVILR